MTHQNYPLPVTVLPEGSHLSTAGHPFRCSGRRECNDPSVVKIRKGMFTYPLCEKCIPDPEGCYCPDGDECHGQCVSAPERWAVPA